jgi:hypothetical protein
MNVQIPTESSHSYCLVLAVVTILVAIGCTEDTVGGDFEFTNDAGPDVAPADEGPPCWPMRRGSPARNSTTPCRPVANELEQMRQIPGLEPAYMGFVRVDGSGTLYALGEDDSQRDQSLYKYEPGADSAEVIQEFDDGWTPIGPQPGDMALDHKGRIWLVEYRGTFSNPSAHRLAAYNPDGSLDLSKEIDIPGSLSGNGLRFHAFGDSIQARLWIGRRRTIWNIEDDEIQKSGEIDRVSGYTCSDGERLFHLEIILDMGSQPPPSIVVRDRDAPSTVLEKIAVEELGWGSDPFNIPGDETNCTVANEHLFFVTRDTGQPSPQSVCVAPLDELDQVSCHTAQAEAHAPVPAGQYGVLFPPGTLYDPEDGDGYSGVDGTLLPEFTVSGIGRNSTVFEAPGQDIVGVTADLETLVAAHTGVDAIGPEAFDVSELNLQDVQWVLPAPGRVYIVDIESDGDDFNRRVFEVTSD